MGVNKMTNSEKGFTLLEVMMAIGVLALLVALMFDSERDQMETQYGVIRSAEMQQSARSAIMLMRDELMMANYDDTGNTSLKAGSSPQIGILSASAGSIAIAYNNPDGTGLRYVTYARNDTDGDGNFEIRVSYVAGGGNSQVLAENITGLVITYFDGNHAVVNPGTGDLTTIRYANIVVTAGLRLSETVGNNRITDTARVLNTNVYFRNMRL